MAIRPRSRYIGQNSQGTRALRELAMHANHYEWVWGQTPPPLARHSEVKHSLLREYLVEYFATLVSSPHQDRIQLTIVDGFCGGGRYANRAGGISPGSPLIILQSIREAQARIEIEQQRRKPIEFDVKLICIDEAPSAIDHLRRVLVEEGFGQQLHDGAIELLQGDFVKHFDDVMKVAVARSPKAGRAIFILDQYGYHAVPLPVIQQIFGKLARAEVILTFAVDALINFLSEKNLADFQRKTGIGTAVSAQELDKLKQAPGWRLQLQSGLYRGLTEGSGAAFFTPFFIRSEKGHGDFWLVHLSMHWKARDVMAATHWKHHNHFVHYGAAGLDMFATGYAAQIDQDASSQRTFEFDDVAATRSMSELLVQIPKALSARREGIAFQDFFAQRVNFTPATRDMVAAAVLKLTELHEIEILRPDGTTSATRVKLPGDHMLRLPAQTSFLLPSD